jgi:hypothetical protein
VRAPTTKPAPAPASKGRRGTASSPGAPLAVAFYKLGSRRKERLVDTMLGRKVVRNVSLWWRRVAVSLRSLCLCARVGAYTYVVSGVRELQ